MSSSMDERKLLKKREKLMDLWVKNHESYVTLIPRYEGLLEQLRQINKHRKKRICLFKIKKLYLDEYPEIELLSLQSQPEAEEYISTLELSEVCTLICTIQDYLNSYIYCTLIDKIADYEYEINHPEVANWTYAMSAESCTGGRKVREHISREDL